MKQVDAKTLRLEIADDRSRGRTIGFVPTMGALHEGHLSLIARAREENDRLVASIFVNPLQFGPREDFATYPRDLESDSEFCREAGVDYLFAPSVEEMYPKEGIDTRVDPGPIGEVLEGDFRPGFFVGVATVCVKLFSLVQPDRAYFGQKDAQQLAVMRQVVADLDLPIEIVGCPTVREPDGLAASSRNLYLDPEDRRAALVVSSSLFAAEEQALSGEREAEALERHVTEIVESEPRARLQYVAVVDPDTFQPVDKIEDRAVIAVAAFVKETRLIDNVLIDLTDRGGYEMRRIMMHAKIHRATVTGASVDYVGSITLDPDLMDAVGILPHEQVHVLDIDNGTRFETYAIEGERGLGQVVVNGAAARLVSIGDRVIVIAYGVFQDDEARHLRPRVVLVDESNRPVTESAGAPAYD